MTRADTIRRLIKKERFAAWMKGDIEYYKELDQALKNLEEAKNDD